MSYFHTKLFVLQSHHVVFHVGGVMKIKFKVYYINMLSNHAIDTNIGPFIT